MALRSLTRERPLYLRRALVRSGGRYGVGGVVLAPAGLGPPPTPTLRPLYLRRALVRSGGRYEVGAWCWPRRGWPPPTPTLRPLYLRRALVRPSGRYGVGGPAGLAAFIAAKEASTWSARSAASTNDVDADER